MSKIQQMRDLRLIGEGGGRKWCKDHFYHVARWSSPHLSTIQIQFFVQFE